MIARDIVNKFMNNKSRLIMLAILGSIAGITICLQPVLNFESGKLQTDKEMSRHYQIHKTAFTELEKLILEAGKEGRLCPDNSNTDVPFKGEQLSKCGVYLEEIGTQLCSNVKANNGSLCIDIPVWARGALSGGPSKGYLYSAVVNPRQIMGDLDEFANTQWFLTRFTDTEGLWLKPLNDDWYIYYRFEK